MAAAVYNIPPIQQGEDWSTSFQVNSSSGAKDLTGYTGKCQIRTASKDAGGKLIINIPVTFSTVSIGVFTLALTAAQTSSIPAPGKMYNNLSVYVYDIELVDPSGLVRRVFNGTVSISPEVTD